MALSNNSKYLLIDFVQRFLPAIRAVEYARQLGPARLLDEGFERGCRYPALVADVRANRREAEQLVAALLGMA